MIETKINFYKENLNFDLNFSIDEVLTNFSIKF